MIQRLTIISTRHIVSFKTTQDVKKITSHFQNKSITENRVTEEMEDGRYSSR
jgi:hypothetical protein